ncbi:MAG TPA: SRPBCC family protein [Candidatus Eisenbacteria bacterium]|nr:SRPBCC family protein [Candidatus Eisenbacteria bacterium]
MRTIVVVLLGAALAAAGCGGKGEPSCPPAKEIATSSVVKNGDTWDVVITSNIEAPVDKVLEAATHPENGHDLVPENLLKTEILKEDGNTKTVDIVARLDILPPGFKVQNIRTEYTYYPQDKRFTTKSIDFKLADITADYKFEPSADGKGTVVKLNQKSKDKSPLILDTLQKQALCETFSIQMKVVRRGLGLDEKPAS